MKKPIKPRPAKKPTSPTKPRKPRKVKATGKKRPGKGKNTTKQYAKAIKKTRRKATTGKGGLGNKGKRYKF